MCFYHHIQFTCSWPVWSFCTRWISSAWSSLFFSMVSCSQHTHSIENINQLHIKEWPFWDLMQHFVFLNIKINPLKMLFFSPFLHFKVCNMVTTKTTLTSCGQNDTDVPRRKQQKTVSISGIALQWEMAVNTQHLGFLESAFKPALRPLHRLNLSFQLLYIRLKTLQLFGTSLKKNTIVHGNLSDHFCPKYSLYRENPPEATWG